MQTVLASDRPHLSLLAVCVVLLTVWPSTADASELPAWLHAPEPGSAGLFPDEFAATVDAELARQRSALDRSSPDSAQHARLAFAVAQLRATRSALGGEATTDPHAEVRPLLAAHLGDDDSGDLRLALALAELAPGAPTTRRDRKAAADIVREALEARLAANPDGDDALTAALALELARTQAASDEPTFAGTTLETVEDRAGAYDVYVTWRRAELARERAAAPTAERLYFALLQELDAENRALEGLDAPLLDSIFLELARAGAGREDGWVRTQQALVGLPLGADQRLREPLLAVYDDAGLPMNRARVRLYLAEQTDENELAEHLDPVVAVAESIAGRPGAQLCRETVEHLGERSTVRSTAVDALVRRCLAAVRDLDRDPDRAEDTLDFFALVESDWPHLLTSRDRAAIGTALMGAGQNLLAHDYLYAVTIDELPEGERGEFGLAAASLRYQTNADIRLDNLSCTLRREQVFPAEDVRYLAWIDAALGDIDDEDDGAGRARFELEVMRLTAHLMNGHYEAGALILPDVVDIANASGDIESATLVATIDQSLACLETAERWREMVALTPTLRRRLDATSRELVFETWGVALTRAYLDLAAALDLVGRGADAAELLVESQRTWRSNPSIAEILFATGSIMAANGERRDGLIYFEQIYEEHDGHPLADDALFYAASLLRDEGDLAGAEVLLERLTRNHGTGEYPQRAQEILDDIERRGATSPTSSNAGSGAADSP